MVKLQCKFSVFVLQTSSPCHSNTDNLEGASFESDELFTSEIIRRRERDFGSNSIITASGTGTECDDDFECDSLYADSEEAIEDTELSCDRQNTIERKDRRVAFEGDIQDDKIAETSSGNLRVTNCL